MLTDERRARMRDNAAHAYQLHMATGVSLDGAYPDLAHDYACDVSDLLDENAALRERLRQAEAIVDDLVRKEVQREARLAAAEQEARRRGEGLAQAERDMAEAEQRERAARAILATVAALEARTDSRASWGCSFCGTNLMVREHDADCVVTQARAWLADRAEQRAASEAPTIKHPGHDTACQCAECRAYWAATFAEDPDMDAAGAASQEEAK